MDTIDYRLTDIHLDPPGEDESIYSEKTVRLPDSFWCYDPLDCQDVPVTPLPAMEKGFVTFGCLNNPGKLNAEIFTLWAEVLMQVKGSHLALLGQPGSHPQWMREILSRRGIELERVELHQRRPRRQYLELYQHIDLGLDCFPYNGHTTSLDSFWMGVWQITNKK